MYFWLNYCNKNHIERVPVAVENIDHLFNMASEIIKGDNLHLFLLSDSTRIDDNEYLSSLKKWYRINRLYGGTNPEIVDLFCIEKILNL